jgi:predicted transcriptional regulator
VELADFYDLLFEVSSDIRLKILEKLKGSESVVTHVADELGISLTEASRHFARLSDSGLIEKTPEGQYRLTFYGDLMLRQLKPLRFTTKHSKYFMDRDLSRLPDMFVNRLNELESSRPNYGNKANVMNIAKNMTRVFTEAEKYVYYILDDEISKLILYPKPEPGNIDKYLKKVGEGVSIRFLFPETVSFDRTHPEMVDMNQRLTLMGKWECRSIEKCDVFIHMTEREVSVLSFPDRNHSVDYLGFEGKSEDLLRWSLDVFDFYWSHSNPIKVYG